MEKELALPISLDELIPNPKQGDNNATFDKFTASDDSKLLQNFGTLNAQKVVFASGKGSENEPTKIKPGLILPYARDDKFVTRKGVFDKLDAALSSDKSQPWAALYGLGGIGKSQIAIEYSYRVRDATPDVWVFWVACNTAESFVQSFRKIAQRLAIPGYADSEIDVLGLVEPWLSDESNCCWFMILDNVDDIDILRGTTRADSKGTELDGERQLLSYIPQVSHGRVLVTSRDVETASQVVPLYEALFKVNFMDTSEALALLRCRIPVKADEEDDARELVDLLDYIPLAISQAGAYIRQLGSLMTIKDYLIYFKKSESERAELLQRQKHEPRRIQAVPNSIILAWAMSFELIKRRDEEAANLLCLLAMLYRQNIPFGLIKSKNNLRTREILIQLEAFSFVTISRQDTSKSGESDILISLHRLIQLAVKRWLDFHGELKEWKIKALTRVSEHFDKNRPTFQNKDYALALALHADEVLSCEITTDSSIEIDRGVLLGQIAYLEYLKGNHIQYLKQATAADDILERYCKEDDLRRSDARLRVGSAKVVRGMLQEAEPLITSVKDDLYIRLGPDDERTQRAMNELGMLYKDQKRYHEAKLVLEEVVDRAEATRGLDYTTMIVMNNLGTLYRDIGLNKEAVHLYTQILREKKKRNWTDDVDTLLYMHNLAWTYQAQGRLLEAERIDRRVSAIQRVRLGADHPHHLYSMGDIIFNLLRQGRYEEAEQLGIEFIEILEGSKRFGPNSRGKLNYCRCLAVAYMGQGRTDDAYKLLQETLERLRTLEGEEHEFTQLAQRTLEMWIFQSMAGLEHTLVLL